MRIQLSDHFTYKRLLRFTLSPILMMVSLSIYSIVDALFISNFVGATAFAAQAFIMPFLLILESVGFMFGSGGSAIIAKTLGEGKKELANQYFSMLVYVTLAVGLTIGMVGQIAIRTVAMSLGGSGDMLKNALIYGRILLVSLPIFILAHAFQSYFIAAEKPELSMKISVITGISNIILDYLFIVVIPLGIAGAAIATAIGQIFSGIVPIIYFSHENNSLLKLVKPIFNKKVLLKTVTNGSSEMVTKISSSIVSMLYNFQLMRYVGNAGVASFGAVMHCNFLFMTILFGFSVGVAPIISYNYGSKNQIELKNVFSKSVKVIITAGIGLFLLSQVFAKPITSIFVGYDPVMHEMSMTGFRFYGISYLFAGLNIFGSSLFTALNDGAVSAAISFLRTLVFQAAAILLLPLLLGVNGIWTAIIFSELLALIVTVYFLQSRKKKYQYA